MKPSLVHFFFTFFFIQCNFVLELIHFVKKPPSSDWWKLMLMMMHLGSIQRSLEKRKLDCKITDTRSTCWLDFQPFVSPRYQAPRLATLFKTSIILRELLVSKINESVKRFSALRGSLNSIHVVTSVLLW